jgi:hypothetical protein
MMAVRWRDPQQKNRALCLIYGPTGVGKTVSCLKSAPKPIYYYECEQRPVEQTCEGNVDLQDGIKIGHIESFEDLIDEITERRAEIASEAKTVIVDSYTYLMNTTLLGQIQRETGKAGVFEKSNRELVNLGRTDMAGYGAMAALMKQVSAALGNLASDGLVVIITALEKDDPKWNRDLAAGPNLAGKAFGDDMPGFFDLIGRVQTHRNSEGKVMYPPAVFFQSDEDNSYLAKWSGPQLDKPFLPLNWEKILNYKRKES